MRESGRNCACCKTQGHQAVAKLRPANSKRSKGSKSRFNSNTMQGGCCKTRVVEPRRGKKARRADSLVTPCKNPDGVRSLVINSILDRAS